MQAGSSAQSRQHRTTSRTAGRRGSKPSTPPARYGCRRSSAAGASRESVRASQHSPSGVWPASEKMPSRSMPSSIASRLPWKIVALSNHKTGRSDRRTMSQRRQGFHAKFERSRTCGGRASKSNAWTRHQGKRRAIRLRSPAPRPRSKTQNAWSCGNFRRSALASICRSVRAKRWSAAVTIGTTEYSRRTQRLATTSEVPMRVVVLIADPPIARWHAAVADAIRGERDVTIVGAHDGNVDVVVDLAHQANLPAARHGVWRYGFGDGSVVADGAAGTLARVYRLTSTPGSVQVLREGWFRAASGDAPGIRDVAGAVSSWTA